MKIKYESNRAKLEAENDKENLVIVEIVDLMMRSQKYPNDVINYYHGIRFEDGNIDKSHNFCELILPTDEDFI